MVIKYIFFDLGDTLIDMSISRKALYFGLKGVLSDKLVTDELVLKWERESRMTFERYFKKGEFSTIKGLQTLSLKNVLLEYGIDLPERKLINIVSECWRYFIKNCQLYEDVIPTLSQLARDGYELGLITNGDEENVIRILKRHDLIEMFKTKVISSYLKTYKPNIKLFHRAIKLAKCSPNEAIYIGDSVIDIHGAEKLGLIVILIHRNKSIESAVEIEPNFKINSLFKLPMIIENIINKKYQSGA